MSENSCELGIAITTYSRKDMVCNLVERIRALTCGDYKIVVCDDGSSDGTVEELRKKGVTVLGGKNKGIAWNKNRGLFYFSNICRAKTVILLDDDVWPEIAGWEQEWILAASRVGHVNYIPSSYTRYSPDRPMTATNLGVGPTVGGMVLAQTIEALACVGYMDTRFGRYGHEHSDFSIRFLRAGFGGVRCRVGDELHNRFYLLDSGIKLLDAISSSSHDDLENNARLLNELQKEPVYRTPWCNEEEMVEFRAEFGSGFSEMNDPPFKEKTFDIDSYYKKHEDVYLSGWDAFAHYVENGIKESRDL
ncbi:hypothetical protein HK22_02640 [Gluconobacter sp. DsW_056]|nr:glycosyltransferase [Gluconobacter sp. DsW_056]OUI81769.1 hypothetical protein HK22_02640 [Gluconobacter sp. DsW_056]